MKKVLIITYYWPPSGGAGVQRWLKLSKYLSRLGVECHVVTVDENSASYMQTDESLLGEIEENVKVYKTKSFEPIKYYEKLVGKKNIPTSGFSNIDTSSFKQKVVLFLRSNFFIPDPRKGWNKYAYKKACEVIQKEEIKNIITTSPPHSTQLIGRKLKQKLKVNWIADFRDPWIDIYYYPMLQHSIISNRINKSYEKSVLEGSDVITTTSYGWKELFESKLSISKKKKIEIVYNGFDSDDFINLVKEEKEHEFSIVYTGTMSEIYNPKIVFDAIDRIVSMVSVKIVVKIIGQIAESIREDIDSRNFDFEFYSTVPHSEIIQFQIDADMLLLIIPDMNNAHSIVPGKLFEYIAAKSPILGLGAKKGDVYQILKDNKFGKMFERNRVEKISDYILNSILNNRNKIMNNAEFFSRKNQAEQIYKLIK